jgi:hypothetical protein
MRGWVEAQVLWETPPGTLLPDTRPPIPSSCPHGHELGLLERVRWCQHSWRCRACEREHNRRYHAAHPRGNRAAA